MQLNERETLLSRIVSGRIWLTDEFYYQPIKERKAYANILYSKFIEQYSYMGALEEEEILSVMYDLGLWSDSQEDLIKKMEKEVEDLKVGLFDSAFNANKRKAYRDAISETYKRLGELYNQKHFYDHLTLTGIANLYKMYYNICAGLHTWQGPVFQGYVFLGTEIPFLQEVMSAYGNSRIDDIQMRELARTEPWRTTWTIGKRDNGVFGAPSTELTDEQRVLALWSVMYDSVYESAECPHDSVIEDDWMLDGWMIVQRREREKDQVAKRGEESLSSKVKKHAEIFMVPGAEEDVENIEKLNNAEAKAVKKQRFEHLKKLGVIKEENLPDLRRKVQMMANQAQFNRG